MKEDDSEKSWREELEFTERACQQNVISKVIADYLADFADLDETTILTGHLVRFQCKNEICVSGH